MLVEKLTEVYQKIKQNFWLGKDEECMEKVGKFVEITIRILEYITSGSFTPIENDLKVSETLKKFENLPKQNFPESIRIIIPRVLYPLYTFRSKRGGAHIKGVNPDHIDATYIISACDWVMAELIRLYYTNEEKEIQKIINSIVDRRVPILEEFGEDLKILDPSLSVPDRILIILYKKHPNSVSTDELKRWVKTKTPTYINTALKKLDDNGFVYRQNKENTITRKEIAYVEDKFKEKL
ncbi:MAG: hypothetical protein LWW95_11470 [Candidatus Desulfofervidus auxilii]|nr:hypothetical protein [Candidatus Desulfofervidus auxilii]